MQLESKRLILRPWSEEDAQILYEYAKDDRVGPIAGWPVHTSVENSREIILHVLSVPQTYAIVLKDTDTVIGCISLMIGEQSHLELNKQEAELGYWLGVPHWRNGYMSEAVRELLRYAFTDLKMINMWCGYYEGNEKSHRVQEACGFQYHHTIKDLPCKLMNDIRTEHISLLSKDMWNKNH